MRWSFLFLLLILLVQPSYSSDFRNIFINFNDTGDDSFEQFLDSVNDALKNNGPSKIVFQNLEDSIDDFAPPSLINDATTDSYKFGEVNFLVGLLEEDWAQSEWNKSYSVARWLVKRYFKVVMNPASYIKDVKTAVEDPKTSIIIWSSHGSTNGTIYDTEKKPLPENIFFENSGKSLKQIVFSNCYGDATVKKYKFHEQLKKHYWEGTTDTDDLFTYLFSKQWDADIEKDLGINIEVKP